MATRENNNGIQYKKKKKEKVVVRHKMMVICNTFCLKLDFIAMLCVCLLKFSVK